MTSSSLGLGPPPAQVPLARYRVLRTTDPDEAAGAGARVMSPHLIRPEAGRQFSWSLSKAAIGRSTLVYHSCENSAELVGMAPTDYYSLHVLLRGASEITSGQRSALLSVAGSAAVISPTEQYGMRFAPGTRQLHAKIPLAAMQQFFGQLTDQGGEDIVFRLSAPPEAAWPTILKLAARSVDALQSSEGIPPRLGSELERTLIASLLLGHPHSASRILSQPSVSRSTRAIEAVADAIRSAPEAQVDLSAVARAHGISLRTLQEGFRHRYGRSPTSLLRDARLDRVYRILTQVPTATVTDAALSSGFTHLGRFARDYRLRYGMSPSDTLRQARLTSADSGAGTYRPR